MKKVFFLTLVLSVFVIYWSGCEDAFGPQPTVISTETGVQARIVVNGNNPASTMWDSILINRLARISSVLSTGNIVRREWKIYRWRTGLLVDTDTATILERTYYTQDTLIFKLKVFGPIASDTNSATLNLRILNNFGGPWINDLYLHSFTPTGTNRGMYYVILPYGRMPVLPSFVNPRTVGTHTGWTSSQPLTDSLLGIGWIFKYEATSYDTIKFNYVVNPNVWSNATGSTFKSPGPDNTYTIVFVNGVLYPSGGGPQMIRPGNVGDTVARYGATPTSLIIYPFHPWIQSPIGTTWNEINVYGFSHRNHGNYSQNINYGIINVPIDSIQTHANQVGFSFGGSTGGVANMSQSPQYDPQTGRIWFQFIGPTNRPLTVGEKIQLKFRDGSIQEIKVQPEILL